jgi:hypothetical protein
MRRDVLAVMKGEGGPADRPINEQELKKHKAEADFNRRMRA